MGQAQIPLDQAPPEFLPRQPLMGGDKQNSGWGKTAKLCAIVTYLLELLDRTLIDTTALVDQICDVVSELYRHGRTVSGAYVQWWSTCRSRHGR